MNTDKHRLFLKEEVYQIVGSCMEILNELGHCLLEKPISVFYLCTSVSICGEKKDLIYEYR